MLVDVIVKETKGKGRGVFVLRRFRRNEFIFRSRKGEVIKPKDMPQLPREKRNHINQIAKGIFEVQQAPECYVNHSCNPNTYWKGKSAYALKSIKKGEELTTDYRIGALNEGWKLKCQCGSKNCTKVVVGDFFSLNKSQQEKFLQYAPKFIQKEYAIRQKSN